MRLEYNNVRQRLFLTFPELKARMEHTFGSYYDLGAEIPDAYPIFEDVIQKIVLELLGSDEKTGLLPRLFDFFEVMACSDDQSVLDLLAISIVEDLISDKVRLARAWPFMGSRMRELATSEANSHNLRDNLPANQGLA